MDILKKISPYQKDVPIERSLLGLLLILLALLVMPASASADCVKDRYGKTVCGNGQCETDIYGKVFCADAGGGAVKDKYGKVLCGTGACAKDYLSRFGARKKPEAAPLSIPSER